MKKITLVAMTVALCFATGFTCSKNAPQTATETTPNATSTETVDQSQMAAPPAGAATPGTAGSETAPAATAPAETTPAATPTETK